MSDTPTPRGDSSAVAAASLRVALSFLRGNAIAVSLVATAVLCYALAGFFLVPHVLRGQIEDYVSTTLQRKVSMGEIRFNPFKFDASMAAFALTENDGRPLLAFRHLYLNAQLSSIWHRAIVLKEFELSSPEVHVRIAKDGTVNLAALVPASTKPATQPAGPPPAVRIGSLAVHTGRIEIEDLTRAQPFHAGLTPIRFALTDFRTDAGHRSAYRFAGRTEAGEELRWSGNFTVQPGIASTGTFEIRRLQAGTIGSYLGESLPFRLADGEIDLHGNYEFALQPLALNVSLPELAIRNIALAELATASSPIRIPSIELQQTAFSLQRRAVDVQSLIVKGAKVVLAREADGSINLQRLLAPRSNSEAGHSASSEPVASATPPPEPGTANSAWSMRARTIRIDAATVLADDRTVEPAAHFEVSPVNIELQGWSTQPGAPFQIDSDITINQQGRLNASGTVALDPLSGDCTLRIADFALPPLQPYLSRTTTLTLSRGALSTNGKLTFASNAQGLALGFDGETGIADLQTTDKLSDTDIVKWRALDVKGIQFRLNPDRLKIDRIVARQPYANVVIAPDSSLNVSRVMKPSGTATSQSGREPPSPPPATKPMPIAIAAVEIIDGSAYFADRSVQPSFATAMLALNGKVAGLSSNPASRARVSLLGKVDRYAPVEIKGRVNLLSAAKYTDLAMNFRNMELTTFNPYSGKFAGYNISKGKLSTELKYVVENRSLKAEHHIVLDNLEFGDKTDSKDAAPIPIKLAVALLKDGNGVIDVNLPVSGTLDDPKFRLGPIIWKAVLGLLTKIVTAPFAALGALFGGGDELAYVDFAAGSAELSAPSQEKLQTLAKALAARPQLRLDVPLTVVDEDDSMALAQIALAQRVPASAEGADDKARRQRLQALESLYRTLTKQAPAYPQTPEKNAADKKDSKKADVEAHTQWIETALVDALAPDPSAKEQLARARAQSVQSALTGAGIDAQRIFITTERKAAAVDRLVRMEMKLE
jgi:uncharacterized protein involved in outer membrane biogenesis/outer membrane protein OmpA-like peptidoglycan-associated protein